MSNCILKRSKCRLKVLVFRVRICTWKLEKAFLDKLTRQLIITFVQWSIEVLEKLRVAQQYAAFCGTRKFVTVFTKARYWCLTLAKRTNSTFTHSIILR
jgi:hypothetical protein